MANTPGTPFHRPPDGPLDRWSLTQKVRRMVTNAKNDDLDARAVAEEVALANQTAAGHEDVVDRLEPDPPPTLVL